MRMKVIALNVTPGHENVVGVATGHPPGDPNARRITLRTTQDAADTDSAWMLTTYLESIAPVIARDGWESALRGFVDADWRSSTAALQLMEDPTNVLGPGPPTEIARRRR